MKFYGWYSSKSIISLVLLYVILVIGNSFSDNFCIGINSNFIIVIISIRVESTFPGNYKLSNGKWTRSSRLLIKLQTILMAEALNII